VIHLNRNRIKNITLWVGILTALLLIFGTFSHSIGILGSDDVFNLVIREVGGEQIRTVSASLLESFQSIII